MSGKPAILEPGLELIVGLGNPGAKYEKTRHNAGFWFVENIARRFSTSFRNEQKFQGELASFRFDGREIRLLKPMTFMNNSGASVSAVANFYKIPANHILIAHDELDLPVGTTRLKFSGGHGGHNGLRDLKALKSNDFWRLRIGINHPGDKNQVTDYVLKQPSQSDRTLIEQSMNKAEDLIELMLNGQMEKTMHGLHSD